MTARNSPPIAILGASELDKLEPHPLADLFPHLDGDDFNRLYTDVAEHGVLNPVTLCAGMILDGRTRVAIARQLRVKCPVIHYEETGHASNPLLYVVSQNNLRGHYTVGQRIMVAAKIANMRQGERTDLHQPSAPVPKVSQEQAAKVMGVSVRSVGHGRYILNHGTPEEIEAASAGRQDPRPLAAIIKRRIEGGLAPEEEDHVDKATHKLEDALVAIGTFRHLHINVFEIVERQEERRDEGMLEKLFKLMDAHDPEQLFAELRTALKATPERPERDADDADVEERAVS